MLAVPHRRVPPAPCHAASHVPCPRPAGDLQGGALTKLALQTMGNFEFGGVNLLEFMRDHILPYLDDQDKEIRQAAVLACCRVLERHAAVVVAAVGVAGAAPGRRDGPSPREYRRTVP